MMSEHRVKHDQHLTHGRGERDLRFLAAKIKDPHHLGCVASRHYQRAHVEQRADLAAMALREKECAALGQ